MVEGGGGDGLRLVQGFCWNMHRPELLWYLSTTLGTNWGISLSVQYNRDWRPPILQSGIVALQNLWKMGFPGDNRYQPLTRKTKKARWTDLFVSMCPVCELSFVFVHTNKFLWLFQRNNRSINAQYKTLFFIIH